MLIAISPIVGLFWAEQFFEKTGAGQGMEDPAQFHPKLPYLLTIFFTIVFFIFGLYGLSASSKYRKLPFLKFGIFAIAFIYLFRAIGAQSYNTIQGTTTNPETVQSLVALLIGLLYLFGGLKKWKLK